MLELRKCLSEKQNVLSRLFHIELKDLIKRGLEIAEKMPVPSIKPHNMECYNSRLFVDLRDRLLSQEPSERNRKIIESIANLAILLYDSDEGWRCMMDEALREIQAMDLKFEEVTRPRWWKEEGNA